MKEGLLMTEIGDTWEIPQPVWAESIARIHCSTRTVNALLRSRYLTLGQLNGLSPNRIIKIRNIGQHGIEELSVEIQKILNQGKSYFPKDVEPVAFEINSIVDQLREAVKFRQEKRARLDFETRFPDLPKTISIPASWRDVAIDSCQLDGRTVNALQRNHLKTLNDLHSVPPYILLHLRGIGSHSVIEFMKKLDELFAGPSPEPRLNFWYEVPADIQEALALIRRNKPISDDRLVFVISARFGLLGQKRLTLQQIGDALNLSRERVRQIEKIGLRRLTSRRGVSDWGKVSAAPEWAKVLSSMDKMDRRRKQ